MQSSDLPGKRRIIRRAGLGCRPLAMALPARIRVVGGLELAEEEGMVMCTRARALARHDMHVRGRFLQVCARDEFDRSVSQFLFPRESFRWIRLRWTGRTVRARTILHMHAHGRISLAIGFFLPLD